MPEGEDLIVKVVQDIAKESYGDLVKPTAKDIGEALSGITKAITYYPRFWAQALDISLGEKIKRFQEKLTRKVDLIPEKNKKLPHPTIVGPTIQALEFAVTEEDLHDFFANLIASSMDNRISDSCHPAFVSVLRDLHHREAIFLKFLIESESNKYIGSSLSKSIFKIVMLNDIRSGIVITPDDNDPVLIANKSLRLWIHQRSAYSLYDSPSGRINSSHGYVVPSSLDVSYLFANLSNLIRLGIVEFNSVKTRIAESNAEKIKSEIRDFVKNAVKKHFDDTNSSLEIDFEILELTPFGIDFVRSCVVNEESHHE
jgi:hypothetical protein